MRVVVICEGATEVAIRDGLRQFVHAHRPELSRLGIAMRSMNGRILRKKLATFVSLALAQPDVAGVVALTDVYPDFKDAEEAKVEVRQWAGDGGNSPRFRAHAAQFEIEAWLIPAWKEIADSLRVSMAKPGAKPEQINGQSPPSTHIGALFAKAKRRYQKAIDGPKWLTANHLQKAALECPELRFLLDSIVKFAESAGGSQ